ncbi:MAG: CDP-alcohol phosphatidyltransferase family protein [Candidatus Saccharimonadales bacterium]
MKMPAQEFDTISLFCEDISQRPDIFETVQDQFAQKQFRTIDFFKPPTLVTAASLALVIDGCRSIDTVSGMNKIVIGRSGDLLDGVLARWLNMTSDAGAFADTAADKLGMLAIATAAWRKDAIPKSVLSTVIAKQTASVALTATTTIRHPDASFRPSRTGKYAMAADNLAFLGYGYANALRNERPDETSLITGAQTLGRVAFAAGSILSVPTIGNYAQRAFRQ